MTIDHHRDCDDAVECVSRRCRVYQAIFSANVEADQPTYASLQHRWLHDAEFHARVSEAVAALEAEYQKDHDGRRLDTEARAFARLAAGFAVEVMERLPSS
jgi:hypothetical protein